MSPRSKPSPAHRAQGGGASAAADPAAVAALVVLATEDTFAPGLSLTESGITAVAGPTGSTRGPAVDAQAKARVLGDVSPFR